MEKIKQNILKIILSCLAFILLWIIMIGLLDYDTVIYEFNPIILMIGIPIYIILLKKIYTNIIPKIIDIKIIPYILIGLFSIVAIKSGQSLKLNPSWDMGSVYKIAENFVNTGSMPSTYLYSFPNNVGIAIVYTILFKIVSLIGITNYSTVTTIFNSLIVILSVILMYLITKKVFNKEKGLMILIISLFTTPFYMYTAIYYTDTLSMFMMLLIVYTYIIVKNIPKERKLKKDLGNVILSTIIFIGFKIKITTIFIVIVYFVYSIFSKRNKIEYKNLFIMIITLIIMAISYNIIENNIILKNKEISNKYKYPIEQWIVMGLKGNGGYNSDEYIYMDQFKTYNEKKKMAKIQIKEKLKEYNANSFIKHLNDKLKYAWTDGSYFAPEKLRRKPINNSIIHEFVLPQGKYVKYYKYIPQVMHMSMLILIFTGIISIIKSQKYNNKNIIIYILILGFITFLLIWENRSRYILTGVPFFIIGQLEGLEYLINSKISKKLLNKNN